MASGVVALAHGVRLERLCTQQRVEQRGFACARLAQNHPHGTARNAGAHLVQPLTRMRGRRDHANARAGKAAQVIGDLHDLGRLAAVDLGEHHHRLGPAITREHERPGHAVAHERQGVALGAQGLHDKNHVDVGGEDLTLPTALSTPALKRRAARQHAQDHAHIMAGRHAHGDKIANGGQQPIAVHARAIGSARPRRATAARPRRLTTRTAATTALPPLALGKIHRVLGAQKRPRGRRDHGEPAVQAHHGAQLDLF